MNNGQSHGKPGVLATIFLVRLAARNIRRNPVRSILSALAVSAAVALILFLSGYILGMQSDLFGNLGKITTSHIRVVDVRSVDAQEGEDRKYAVTGPDGGSWRGLADKIRKLKGVKAVSARIPLGVLIQSGSFTVPVICRGVDIELERGFFALDAKPVLKTGHAWKKGQKGSLVAKGLAEKLGLEPGDKLVIWIYDAFGSIKVLKVPVTGIIAFGISAMDERTIYVPIDLLARKLGIDPGASELVVLCNRLDAAPAVQSEIDTILAGSGTVTLDNGKKSNRLASRLWTEDNPFISNINKIARIEMAVLYIVFLIIGSTVIISTTMMVIHERKKEIGMLGAMGMPGKQIVSMFVIEAFFIAVLGSAWGCLWGGLLNWYLSVHGINIAALSGGNLKSLPINDIIHTVSNRAVVLSAFAFGVIVATVCAWLPARRAARIRPAKTLRSL